MARSLSKDRDPIKYRRHDGFSGYWACENVAETYKAHLGCAGEPDLEFVYFVHCPLLGLVKIGYAFDVDLRLRAIRSLSPARIKLLGAIPGDVYRESHLHRRFRKERKHGEWFRVSERLARYIRLVLKKEVPSFAAITALTG